MLVKSRLASTVRCRHCGFTSLANLPTQPAATFRKSIINRSSQAHQHSQRWFSSSPRSVSDLVQWRAPTEDSQIEDMTTEEINEESNGRGETVPWYLQVKRPQREIKSLSDRQRLPDLPPDPPPLLHPMLEHISIDLGLDDLSLIDLRQMDPPPALGANLIMIIGTARSEKHLHVSAERFCRWLRSTHKLRPYADGLLGRGELRLKLKRKNRRMKMLNSVGASEISTSDDGIRTGWVCVNVGVIEDGRLNGEEDIQVKDDPYVGFGSDFYGARVVVQMLTEEKREELDLEMLWGQALARHKRRADRINLSQEEPAMKAGITALDMETAQPHSKMASATAN